MRITTPERLWMAVMAGIALAMLGASARPATADTWTRAYAVSASSLIPVDVRYFTSPLVPPAVTTGTAIPITGLTAGDTLVGIDFRPQNGYLYGLGYNAGAGTVQLYAISVRTGHAAAIGTTGTFVTGGGVPLPIDATGFGFDFNPAADRIRVVAGNQNFRIDPNTGAFVDGDLGNAPGTIAGLNRDGDITGAAGGVEAAAYTNNQQNTTVTTLHTLSAASNSLYIQNPPNGGAQTVPVVVTLNGVPLDFTSANGFDILPHVDAPSNNAVATGIGVAALTVGGVTSLYEIDLATGAARLLAAIGDGTQPVQGLAVQGEIAFEQGAIDGLPVITSTSTSLVRFNSTRLTSSTNVTVTGLTAGEVPVGLDWRPQTGQLFALGFDATNGTGSASLYRLDPQTGAATLIGAAGGIANGAGSPVNLAGAASFGFDFNPAVDRIRIVTDNGINVRVNPNTGAPVLPVDGTINGLPGGATGLSGAAYTNSSGNNMLVAVTRLYTLDAGSDRLFIQTPPNAGTQTNGLPITLNGSPLDFTSAGGFDISPAVEVTDPDPSDNPASGRSYAVLTVGGVTSLYQINLGSGVATLLGATPGGAALTGLAVGDGPPRFASIDVTTSVSPAAVGQTVTFTARMQPADAAGTVMFRVDGAAIAGCDAQPTLGGTTTCATSFPYGGRLWIDARYSGGNGFRPANSPTLIQQVSGGATASTVSVGGDPNPSLTGQTVTFTATVAPVSATGQVRFFIDGALRSVAPVAGGVATFTTNALPAGVTLGRAEYGGDATYGASETTFTQTVSADSFKQFFAEGATGFFQTDIGFFNTSPTTPANVTVRMFPEGGTPIVQTQTLLPLTRKTLDLEAIVGAAGGAGVSTYIESDQPIAAMRQMTYGEPVYGSTLESGVGETGTTWYFAEGATNVYSLFYLIQNPSGSDANVTLTHLLEGGGTPIVQNVVVPGQSRRTYFINDAPGLAAANLSTVITSDVPIVAERAMYLNTTNRLWEGGTAGRGATALSSTWSFAEGATGFFHTYLLLGNPAPSDQPVTVTYQLPDGSVITKDYLVAAESRRTIDVNFEAPQLASTSVGMKVVSVAPIVAERAIWWGTPFYEGSVSVGSTLTGTTWGIGEAIEGGPNDEAAFVLVTNGTTTTGTVRFMVIYDDGTNEQKEYPLLGNARLTVRLGEDFPRSLTSRVSVLVESLTPAVGITVETARYQSSGNFLNGGGAALATRIR